MEAPSGSGRTKATLTHYTMRSDPNSKTAHSFRRPLAKCTVCLYKRLSLSIICRRQIPHMVSVISAERAVSEGVNAVELIAIAEWHEDRIDEIGNLSGKERDRAKRSIARHRRLASELRETAALLPPTNANLP